MFSPKVVFAQNLLQNPGFEEGIDPWKKYGGVLEQSDLSRTGDYSAKFSNTTTTAYYFYQEVNFQPLKNYKYSGYVKAGDNNSSEVYLKIKLDNGSEFMSSKLSPTPDYQMLIVENISIPENISKGKVYAYLDPSVAQLTVVYFDDFSFEEVNPTPTSTPIPNLTLNPTSTPKPPTPTPNPTATYKINEIKDEDGEILKNVKVYVDDVYLHHYAPEVLTFCEGCQCDSYVSCDFGQHQIKLEKTGYQSWSETKLINMNDFYEVNPVMVFSEPESTPTPTSISLTFTPMPSQKISPTATPVKKPDQVATDSGEILGEETVATTAFYSYQASSEAEKNEATPSAKNKILPKIFLISGLLFLFISALWLWYNFKNYTNL